MSRATNGLRRVEGPACPGCGCTASEVVGRVQTFGGPSEKRRCLNCLRPFTPPPTPPPDQDGGPEAGGAGGIGGGGAVIFQVLRCPDCGSRDTKITSTRLPIRHHKCEACGHCFKSVER